MAGTRYLNVHLINTPLPNDLHTLLDSLDSSIQVTTGAELPAPALYEILVAGRPTAAHLDASPHLHTLIIPFAGLPDTTRHLLQDYPHLAVHNLHHNASDAAELALALLLAAAKFIVPFDRALRQGDWTPRYQTSPAISLRGLTVLILGFGQIGRRVGRVCHALGMPILGIKRHPERDMNLDYPIEIYAPEKLVDLLPQCQVLLISAPMTADTEEMIGARELSLLPPNSLLVNVGRGAIVDQAALYHALKSGKLAAAGLDVWYNYPSSSEDRVNTPPADHPFHELDNVVFSPHRAGLTGETEPLRMGHLADLLNRAARGQPLPNRVDPVLGY